MLLYGATYVHTMSFTVFLDPNMVSPTTAVTLPRHFTRFFSPGWMNTINQCLCQWQWLRHIESLVSLISQPPKPDEPAKSLVSPSPMSIYRTSLRNISLSHMWMNIRPSEYYQTEGVSYDVISAHLSPHDLLSAALFFYSEYHARIN